MIRSLPLFRFFANEKPLDRVIRRLFPSTSLLTFNPVFRLLANATDVPARLVWPEFRRIPPNHLRIRVGVGNRLFNNQSAYIQSGAAAWLFAFAQGYARVDSDILEIGVGNGREIHVLRDLSYHGFRFTGTLVGIDIDAEAIAYCRRHFDSPRFRFHVARGASVSHNSRAVETEPYRIPEPDQTFDYITSGSVFTHLLSSDLENYLGESFRLLRSGGVAVHSVFSVDHPPRSGGRHDFCHRIGPAHVVSLAQPEAAVAYRECYLSDAARRAGFSSVEFIVSADHFQPLMVCRKG